jgi:hypothetical protein
MSPYQLHENFSLTRMLTGLTNSWYQESMKSNANRGTFWLGQFGSRIVNLLILPTALIDSVGHVAMAIFTFAVGAPLGLLYNARQWYLNSDGKSRFTFSGGIVNLLNAKKHFPCAYLGIVVGLLNPEAVVNFF